MNSDLYCFMPLSLIFTLAYFHVVNRKQNLISVFSYNLLKVKSAHDDFFLSSIVVGEYDLLYI